VNLKNQLQVARLHDIQFHWFIAVFDRGVRATYKTGKFSFVREQVQLGEFFLHHWNGGEIFYKVMKKNLQVTVPISNILASYVSSVPKKSTCLAWCHALLNSSRLQFVTFF
jgi:hypothetical protein